MTSTVRETSYQQGKEDILKFEIIDTISGFLRMFLVDNTKLYWPFSDFCIRFLKTNKKKSHSGI